MYARVVSATRPAKGAALTRVLLESGPGGETLEALSSEVFTFRLVSELGPDETGAGAGGGSGRDGPEPTFTASRDPLEADAVTPADPGGEFTSPTRRADCADSGFDSSRDPVSSDDLVRAVRDLLTAAGAPPVAAAESAMQRVWMKEKLATRIWFSLQDASKRRQFQCFFAAAQNMS